MRNEIDQAVKWRLEDIFSSDDEWEKEYAGIQPLVDKIQKYQGTLGTSADHLLASFQDMEHLDRQCEKLLIYARMRRDEDNGNTKYQALYDRIESLSIQTSSVTAFITPELSSLDQGLIQSFMENNKELAVYRHLFDELWRQKEHILSFEEERILAMSADLSISSKNTFTMLNNADIKFPMIKDEEGHEIELTKGRFGRFMESKDRRVRKEAFQGLYGSYAKLKNTVSSTFSASVKSDIFYSRVRNYPSSLEASLQGDNIDPRVYQQLIESVHSKLPYLQRYVKLRQKMLGLDDLHVYDLYVSLIPEYKLEVPYEKARETVVEALQPLGHGYLDQLGKGMHGGWIDVYENQGKTSGAYSWGSYDTHPYVLMNYDDKLDDLFTLAHEMGHSMHSFYSNQAQPYVYSQYPIFLAEVASTVNESLLIDHLLKKTNDRQEKLYLINHYLEQFRGTVYRQTLFAEFEKIIHEKAEAGEALTPDMISQVYLDLNRLYYGSQLILDEEIALEWMRIPHFYSAFYVYKYATGFSAATAIKEQIVQEGEAAVKRYLNFLQSGGSDYPVLLLQKAGVDLTQAEPVEKALDFFAGLLDEMESLIE
ncbi:MAG TPA: oligoendopeptidase F [Syntrophomonadaceae bacterium]|nr:oligoendopeptidase F [Syntrophomonadaceae bacterium]